MTNTISSDRGAQSAKPGPNGQRLDYTVRGAPGLRLRVSRAKDGSIRRSWSVLSQRPDNGAKFRYPLGELRAVSLKQAKDEAARVRLDASQGKDPAGERKKAKEAITFGELAEMWLELHSKAKKRSWREDERMIRTYFTGNPEKPATLKGKIGSVKAEKMSTDQITNITNAIASKGFDGQGGAPYQANRVLGLAKTIYRWGVRNRKVNCNPVAEVDKPANETDRERALTIPEVRQFWTKLDTVKEWPLSKRMQIILRLSLLLGQRINELALARKNEFDLDAKRWNLPGVRVMPGNRKESGAKNKSNHPLPLSEKAIELLRQAFELAGRSEWLFPSRTKEGPIGEAAVSRAWGRARGELKLADLQARDLRRSFATVAGWCGYKDFDIGLVLNHITTRGPVTSIYNRAEYLDEKREVIEAVGRRLFEFIEGGDSGGNNAS